MEWGLIFPVVFGGLMRQYADFCPVTTSYMEETKMSRSKLASLGTRVQAFD